jgi:hypothetical protein
VAASTPVVVVTLSTSRSVADGPPSATSRRLDPSARSSSGRPGAGMTPSSVGLVNTTTSLMFLLAGSGGTVPAAHPGFGPA